MAEESKREVEILKLISLGYSTKDIANHLNVSNETVKSHRKNLLKKLSARNSANLIRNAFYKDLIASYNSLDKL
jgi:DNA-binding NarL/FixJ family response regulator